MSTTASRPTISPSAVTADRMRISAFSRASAVRISSSREKLIFTGRPVRCASSAANGSMLASYFCPKPPPTAAGTTTRTALSAHPSRRGDRAAHRPGYCVEVSTT